MSAPFVTIVSSDRDLLRDLSWTLSLFGYEVTATLDYSEECPVSRPAQPGIFLVDTRSCDDTNKLLNSPQSSNYTYRVAIDLPAATEQLLLQGADDVIRYPINKGELLTRLRAGVRRVEFESRLSDSGNHEASTGLLSREALVRRVSADRATTKEDRCCVAFGIDYLNQIHRQYGSHSTQHLKSTLARCIAHSLAADETAGIICQNVMLAVLNRPCNEAQGFIDAVNNTFASSDTLVREIRVVSTLTAVVADWSFDRDVNEHFDHCASTLEQAHYFGGDFTAAADEVQQLVNSWRTDLDAGVPFQDVVAQDLMELFPAILSQQQADTYTTKLATSNLQVPCLPIVDSGGTLCGAIDFASSASATSLPNTIEFNQPLNDLFEVFNSTESDYLIVVDHENCPLGYLTCEGLASLVLDKMDTDRYQQTRAGHSPTESLVVPVVPTIIAETVDGLAT